jgi:maltose alpha-D-glucosyltransferase/alpha-amylase
MTLAPHAFHWFLLESTPRPVVPGDIPVIAARGDLDAALRGSLRRQLTQAIAGYIGQQRWYAGKARRVQDVEIIDVIPIEQRRREVGRIILVSLEYTEGEPETYAVPVVVAKRPRPVDSDDTPDDVIAELDSATGVALCDGSTDPQLATALFELVRRGRSEAGSAGRITGVPARGMRSIVSEVSSPAQVRSLGADQSNTSLLVGERALMKLLRKVDAGDHPEVELGRHLNEVARFPYAAPFGGVLEYEAGRQRSVTLASVTGFVVNDGDAWTRSLEGLGRFYDQAASEGVAGPPPGAWPSEPLSEGLAEPVPIELVSFAAEGLEDAGHLGVRTAQLHRALASGDSDAFRPLPFTRLYQRSLYQSLRSDARSTLRQLARRLDRLDPANAEVARAVIGREPMLLERFSRLTTETIEADRVRIHGDLHLAQVLVAGTDVVFIDFEGEPARPIGERLIKRTVFRDVAGMLRSYDYAARVALEQAVGRGIASPDSAEQLEAWGRLYVDWVSRAYLDGYLNEARGERFIPSSSWATELLLEISLLQKAVYELGYELANRPNWVHLPLRALDELTARLIAEPAP